MKNSTREGRSNDELRPLSAEIDIQTAGSGAVLMTMGETRVLCVASVSTSVPDHAANRGWGWVTAEYTMLPYSTIPRTEKRPMRPDGRSVEIQRLVGRSLRSIADLSRLRGFSITVDCRGFTTGIVRRAASVAIRDEKRRFPAAFEKPGRAPETGHRPVQKSLPPH